MSRCMTPLGMQTSNCVGRMYFGRRRCIHRKSALLILSGHRCRVGIGRTRTTLLSMRNSRRILRSNVRATRAGVTIRSTGVTRTGAGL